MLASWKRHTRLDPTFQQVNYQLPDPKWWKPTTECKAVQKVRAADERESVADNMDVKYEFDEKHKAEEASATREKGEERDRNADQRRAWLNIERTETNARVAH